MSTYFRDPLRKWSLLGDPSESLIHRGGVDIKWNGPQSLSKWTPKRMTAMSMSKRNVRWPALRSVLGPILSCFLRLRAFYFYAGTDWHQSGKYRKLLVSSAIFITKNRKQWQPHTLHSLCINATRASNALEPFNGPISRVNLPLFTLIVRKGKVSETLILRFWTWVKKPET